MVADDEITAVQLHTHLAKNGYNISLATILRCCSSLGWTFRGSAYCQLIRDANKIKRMEWAKKNLEEKFEDVIYNIGTFYNNNNYYYIIIYIIYNNII